MGDEFINPYSAVGQQYPPQFQPVPIVNLANPDDDPEVFPSPSNSPEPGPAQANGGADVALDAHLLAPSDFPSSSSTLSSSASTVGLSGGRVRFSWKKLWHFTGPGFLMSIAYLDPGNLTSDLQSGAYTGYELIWVLFVATLLGLLLQVLAARLGVVTGHDLAQLCRANYSRRTSILLWIMTELAIIGSDIQEVIGSAIAFNLLLGLPLYAGVLITGADTFTFLALHYFGVRKLEALFCTLIGTMCLCFFVDFGYIQPSGSGIMKGFIPSMSSYAVLQAVGLIGAVIMPHNFYLHSALVKSRAVDRRKEHKVREANFYFAIESAVALGVSFLINLAVVSVFAAGFFKDECAQNGQAWVGDECREVSLEDAGTVLEKALGSTAKYVWGIGLLAAGQSATMTGTYAGQFVMEGFVSIPVPQWQRVLFTRAIALGPALLVALLANGNTDVMSAWLNVLQSVQLPFALLPLLHFTSSPKWMGNFANSTGLAAFVWVFGISLIALNFYLVINQLYFTDMNLDFMNAWWFITLLVIVMLLYLTFIFFIIKDDIELFIGKVKTFLGRKNGTAEESRPRDVSLVEDTRGATSILVAPSVSLNQQVNSSNSRSAPPLL